MHDSLDSILWEVALLGKIQSRCDGAGSAADGTKPPVKPGLMMPVLGVLVFWPNCRGEVSERRLWIDKTRSCRAAFARLSFCLLLPHQRRFGDFCRDIKGATAPDVREHRATHLRNRTSTSLESVTYRVRAGIPRQARRSTGSHHSAACRERHGNLRTHSA